MLFNYRLRQLACSVLFATYHFHCSRLLHLLCEYSLKCPIRRDYSTPIYFHIPNSRPRQGMSGQILVHNMQNSWLHHHHHLSIQAVDKLPSHQSHPTSVITDCPPQGIVVDLNRPWFGVDPPTSRTSPSKVPLTQLYKNGKLTKVNNFSIYILKIKVSSGKKTEN